MNQTVQLLKALAEPTRLRIVALCRAGGDLAVSEFVRILGQSQPRVSRHLKLLTEAGALARIPEGSWVFYRIDDSGPAAAIVAALIDNIPADDITFQRDRERLAAVKRERADAADAFFSANAKEWSNIRRLHIDQKEVNACLTRLVGDQPMGAFLDIGTGTGDMLSLFADRIERGEGIDQSRDMLAVARSTLENDGLTHCRVRQGDLYSLPYDGAEFDTVLIHQVLHYVDDVAGAIAEAARVLAPGGRLLIADFAPHEVEDLRKTYQHRRLGFADFEFDAALTDAGLTLDGIEHLTGDPLTVVVWSAVKPGISARRTA
ncbi:MAG: metalloregulator ArsR/SmtB family transcription factor [Rhodospirillales bacterium]|nr:metalloregulator ArsR/SmtB family transcription factor [Rhodospirillales bacterium]MBO6788344.1 metalloregulator ArsR/SmtB family transcription factor [Rhodospirillales bacterium]